MITLMEFMEDFDYTEYPEHERQERLYEAVLDYNEEYGTHYDPQRHVIKYLRWIKEKYQPEM